MPGLSAVLGEFAKLRKSDC